MKTINRFTYLYLFCFISLFFLWNISFSNIFLLDNYEISLKYLILLLLIPLLINNFNKKKLFSIFSLFNNQKYILYFVIFVVLHFFIVNFYYGEQFQLYEISKLLFFVLLSLIYSNYRNFLFKNFEKIILIYLILFIFFSLFNNVNTFNVGACNNKFFLINFFSEKINFNLSNSFYKENSHLAMMMVSVLYCQILILQKNKNSNFRNICLFILSNLIILFNYSTTFYISYLFSFLLVILFFLKKIKFEFWVITIFVLFINSVVFFTDKNCKMKINDFNLNDIKELKLEKNTSNKYITKNLTTFIYERSSVLTINTILHNKLGWGFDGMDNATKNLLNNPKYADVYVGAKVLNLNDGLSNFFKILNEFGIFSLIILFIFIKYLINQKTLSIFNLFIITLFITLCIRGAGYFNGGFIFCLFEFLYLNKSFYKSKFNLKKETEKNF